MGDRRKDQAERMARYAHLIEQQTGKAVRPFRADGYVNLLNRYGTQQDTTERYRYQAEPMVPDELLTMYYEGNGLFAKIIDTPAEEAIKHGFKLEGLKDQRVEDFFTEALDELDWEETAMTAIRWARLFGGSIAVMLLPAVSGEACAAVLDRIIARFLDRHPRCPLVLRRSVRALEAPPPDRRRSGCLS